MGETRMGLKTELWIEERHSEEYTVLVLGGD